MNFVLHLLAYLAVWGVVSAATECFVGWRASMGKPITMWHAVFLLIAVLILFALAIEPRHAHADPPKAETRIDPTQIVRDPHGHAFLPCGKDEAADCAKDQTLGFFVYLALGAQAQRDPRAGPAAPDPEAVVRAALGWRIYDSQAPLEVSEAQRVMIRKALLTNLSMPNVAYAACRMIGDPSECDKP